MLARLSILFTIFFMQLFYATMGLMVMAALALHGVDDRFDDNESHANTDNAQRVPQAAVNAHLRASRAAYPPCCSASCLSLAKPFS